MPGQSSSPLRDRSASGAARQIRVNSIQSNSRESAASSKKTETLFAVKDSNLEKEVSRTTANRSMVRSAELRLMKPKAISNDQ